MDTPCISCSCPKFKQNRQTTAKHYISSSSLVSIAVSMPNNQLNRFKISISGWDARRLSIKA